MRSDVGTRAVSLSSGIPLRRAPAVRNSGRYAVPMPSGFDVACIGLVTADTIVAVPSWPAPDGRVISEPIVRSGGGPAATAAVTAARLGCSVALFGAVGDDASGADLVGGLV